MAPKKALLETPSPEPLRTSTPPFLTAIDE